MNIVTQCCLFIVVFTASSESDHLNYEWHFKAFSLGSLIICSFGYVIHYYRKNIDFLSSLSFRILFTNFKDRRFSSFNRNGANSSTWVLKLNGGAPPVWPLRISCFCSVVKQLFNHWISGCTQSHLSYYDMTTAAECALVDVSIVSWVLFEPFYQWKSEQAIGQCSVI